MRRLEDVDGIGPGAAEELREASICTAELLAIQNPNKLQRTTKLGELTTRKLVRNARVLLGMDTERNGLELDEHSHSMSRLSTGLRKLDMNLMGGFPKGSIIEFYGPARSGKTHICHQLSLLATLPKEKGGFDKRVLWLSTEDSFKPRIFKLLAHRFDADPEISLSRVAFKEFQFAGQLLDRLPEIFALCTEREVGMVVLDSISFDVWSENVCLEYKINGLRTLHEFMSAVRRFTKATGIIFLYTNQVYHKIAVYGGYDNAPMGSHVLSHASDYRFYMRLRGDDDRVIVLKDNAEIPPFELQVKVGYGGLYDDPKNKKEWMSENQEIIEDVTGKRVVEEQRRK